MVVTLANIAEPGVVALIRGVSGQRLGQEAAVAATFFEEKKHVAGWTSTGTWSNPLTDEACHPIHVPKNRKPLVCNVELQLYPLVQGDLPERF